MNLDLNKVIVSPEVLFQKLGDEAVLLHLQTEEYFGLNEVGARFWEIISQENRTNNALETLLTEFDVEKAIIKADLEALIHDLIKEKLLLQNA